MMWERKSAVQDASFAAKPDLVILDGGKGQLSTVLKNVKFPKTTHVVALAKREEEIFKTPPTPLYKRGEQPSLNEFCWHETRKRFIWFSGFGMKHTASPIR